MPKINDYSRHKLIIDYIQLVPGKVKKLLEYIDETLDGKRKLSTDKQAEISMKIHNFYDEAVYDEYQLYGNND